jgi:hypothetical protein
LERQLWHGIGRKLAILVPGNSVVDLFSYKHQLVMVSHLGWIALAQNWQCLA